MAITPLTGFKSFTFDGEVSTNYGVQILGEGVFNAPERSVEMIEIPGRNGAYALDKGRFENIEVTYPANIIATNTTDFADAVSDLRNMLCSRKGYCRLTDDYHPNEYRMAVYKSGLEVDEKVLRAGEFDIVFECKPQRWLTSGESKTTMGAWGDTTTVTDDIVEIDNSDGILSVKDDTVAIEAVQSGSGTPSPDNVRAISGWTDVNVYVGAVSGTPTTTYNIDLSSAGTVYGGTLDVTTGELTVTHGYVDLGTLSWTYISGNADFLAKVNDMAYYTTKSCAICSHYKVIDSARTALADKQATTNMAGVSSTAFVIIKDTSYTDAASFKTAVNGAQLVYELATPTTYTLTAQEIELLTGTNYVWADTGDSTIEYGQDPNIIVNPTLFDASPMLEVEGYGTIDINGYDIDIENETLGDITLWDSNPHLAYTSDSFPIAAEKTFDTEKILTNDVLTLGYDDAYSSVVQMGIIFYVNSGYTFNVSGSSESGSGTMPVDVANVNFYKKSGSSVYSYIYVWVEAQPLTFNVGTSGIYTYQITANGTITNTSTQVQTAYEVTGDYTVEYDGDRTITYTWNPAIVTDSTGAITYMPPLVECSYGILHAESSVSILGTPTYIDCDLGVVYMIKNGTVIDLNSYVDLGSDMPVLSPGSNTITYDNTVTDLKVIPRWWKV